MFSNSTGWKERASLAMESGAFFKRIFNIKRVVVSLDKSIVSRNHAATFSQEGNGSGRVSPKDKVAASISDSKMFEFVCGSELGEGCDRSGVEGEMLGEKISRA